MDGLRWTGHPEMAVNFKSKKHPFQKKKHQLLTVVKGLFGLIPGKYTPGLEPPWTGLQLVWLVS
jgi:hypothetical protein